MAKTGSTIDTSTSAWWFCIKPSPYPFMRRVATPSSSWPQLASPALTIAAITHTQCPPGATRLSGAVRVRWGESLLVCGCGGARDGGGGGGGAREMVVEMGVVVAS